MFYEQLVLAKKGLLANVWLAAHWEKKLTKQQIATTDIADTANTIAAPKAPMALRLSGHLLLGVVKIYYKKVYYLYTDCSEALVKIKMAFRPAVNIDLEESVANLASITRSDTYTEYELVLPEVDIMDIDFPEDESHLIISGYQPKEIIPMHMIQEAGDDTNTFIDQGFLTGELEFDDNDAFRNRLDQHDMDLLVTGTGGFLELNDQFLPSHLDSSIPEFVPNIETAIEVPSMHDASYHEPEASIEYTDFTKTKLLATPLRRPKRALSATLDHATQLSNEVIERAIKSKIGQDDSLIFYPSNKRKMLASLRLQLPHDQYFSTLLSNSIPIPLQPTLLKYFNIRHEYKPPVAAESSEISLEIEPHRGGAVTTALLTPSSIGSEIFDMSHTATSTPLMLYPMDDGSDIFDQQYMPMIDDIAMPMSMGGQSQSTEIALDNLKSGMADYNGPPSTTRRDSSVSEPEELADHSKKLYSFFRNRVDSAQHVVFNHVLAKKSKRMVAISFLSVLEMKTKDYIDVKQDEPYGSIMLTLLT